MNESNDLRKCSRCHTIKLKTYFSINTKGLLNKCCDNCRESKKKSVKTNKTITKDDILIAMARSEFIERYSRNGDYMWLGPASTDDINFPINKYPPPNGDEKIIEYHVFKDTVQNFTHVIRWRLRPCDLPVNIIECTDEEQNKYYV
jgi:hypothetical protein